MPDELRLTEILTTSSAVANYRGVPDVRAVDVLDATRILREEITLEDLGRPRSPLLSRVSPAGKSATHGVRELAQRWFAELGSDPTSAFGPGQFEQFLADLLALAAEEAGGTGPEDES